MCEIVLFLLVALLLLPISATKRLSRIILHETFLEYLTILNVE